MGFSSWSYLTVPSRVNLFGIKLPTLAPLDDELPPDDEPPPDDKLPAGTIASAPLRYLIAIALPVLVTVFVLIVFSEPPSFLFS